jgi:hypothetical protein
MSPASGCGDPGLGSDPHRHAVQPASDRLAATDRAGPPRENQERRLGGVLGVVLVTQNLPANAQNHRRVTIDQGRKGRLGRVVSPLHEPLEQLAVGQPASRPRSVERLDLLEDLHRWIGKGGF